MRHRQTAARARGRQHSRRRHADVPQSLGAHSKENAEERPRQSQRRSTRSACRSNFKPLWKPCTGIMQRHSICGKKHGINVPPCFIVVCNNTSTSKLVYDYISGFHRENEDGINHAGERSAAAVPEFRRARQPARPAKHAADRQRATRIRRCAGRQLPRHGRRRDRALPPRDHRTHRRRPIRRRTSPTRICSAK